MGVHDPNAEVLTIRVKSRVLLYSPAVGACVVHLRQLQLGSTVDEWFPLYRNDKASGEIRLQICLQQNVATAEPQRRYSQPSEEVIRRLLEQHRELEEARRRELELEQQQRWRQMEDDALKRVGLEEQVQREEKWREQCAKKLEVKYQGFQAEDSDSDLPESFKYRGAQKEQAAAKQMMDNRSLREDAEKNKELEMKFGVPSGYTIYGVDSDYTGREALHRQLTGFGTIRLSVEEMEQVVQNALPSSDSSDSTESEQESRHRRRRDGEKQKRRGSKKKKHAKRRVHSDDDSPYASSVSSTGYRKKSSTIHVPEEKMVKKKSTLRSTSFRSKESNQNQQNEDIPITLTFPGSESDKSPTSYSEEERRRRRRRRAENSKRHENERKRRSKRKPAKSRRNCESSYSSSSVFSSSSSSLSSSEEERLRRKLKKIESRKFKTRAIMNESGDSHASTRTSGMGSQHKLSYDDDSGGIDFISSPYIAQHRSPERAEIMLVNGAHPADQACLPVHLNATKKCRKSGYSESLVSTARDNSDDIYGPDGVGFDEPGVIFMPKHLGQTMKKQSNAELTRSFCF
ncbi:unnamed protein product [Phytophthora fragariaefolia]|uniref:Unnamed protein product n=1 Tax=Phytophthora fragariaefolia TaxID=1490495 RepID=A0A9W6TRX1_9STRA|nr:unnamed protein product [Phytophthora fragariaefolia]